MSQARCVIGADGALPRDKLLVHMLHEPTQEALSHLLDSLDPRIELTFGMHLPEPAEYQILVAGRPQREHLLASPRLTALIIPFAGLPAVTRDLLLEHQQIAVHNLHHNPSIVAEMALGMLIAVSRRLLSADQRLRAGDWSVRWTPDRPKQLRGQKALVVGYGALGREVARLLCCLGMQVSAISRSGRDSSSGSAVRVFPVMELHNQLPHAHAVVICLPSTPETDGLIGAEELSLLPQGALLVNVGRALVVDERALFQTLRDSHLGGAALDVWYRYPESKASRRSTLPSKYPFAELENVLLSPHRSGHVAETERLRMEHLCRSLNAAASGEPIPHRVDVVQGY